MPLPGSSGTTNHLNNISNMSSGAVKAHKLNLTPGLQPNSQSYDQNFPPIAGDGPQGQGAQSQMQAQAPGVQGQTQNPYSHFNPADRTLSTGSGQGLRGKRPLSGKRQPSGGIGNFPPAQTMNMGAVSGAGQNMNMALPTSLPPSFPCTPNSKQSRELGAAAHAKQQAGISMATAQNASIAQAAGEELLLQVANMNNKTAQGVMDNSGSTAAAGVGQVATMNKATDQQA